MGNEMSKLIAVVTTVATEDDARRIAKACVERRLAACIQLSHIASLYYWNGQLQEDREVRLLLKTTEARYGELESALRELHPYDLPAIYALEVNKADTAYASWVEQETTIPRP
jgi:periplasmic divalent cation tolerance protein